MHIFIILGLCRGTITRLCTVIRTVFEPSSQSQRGVTAVADAGDRSPVSKEATGQS